jgi:hypothetical protein
LWDSSEVVSVEKLLGQGTVDAFADAAAEAVE